MKNLLAAMCVSFILAGTLGFRPLAESGTGTTPKPIQIKGVIQAISLEFSALNVSGVIVHVSPETAINATVAMGLGIEDLVVGTMVQVYGSLNKEGLMIASRIDLLP